MKVICIDGRWDCDEPKDEKVRKPQMSDVCEVVEIFVNPEGDGLDYYELAGFVGYFETRAFAPLSSIDETQLLTKEREVYETRR